MDLNRFVEYAVDSGPALLSPERISEIMKQYEDTDPVEIQKKIDFFLQESEKWSIHPNPYLNKRSITYTPRSYAKNNSYNPLEQFPGFNPNELMNYEDYKQIYEKITQKVEPTAENVADSVFAVADSTPFINSTPITNQPLINNRSISTAMKQRLEIAADVGKRKLKHTANNASRLSLISKNSTNSPQPEINSDYIDEQWRRLNVTTPLFRFEQELLKEEFEQELAQEELEENENEENDEEKAKEVMKSSAILQDLEYLPFQNEGNANFYTVDALETRRRLRQNPRLLKCFELFWILFQERDSQVGLLKTEYLQVHVRIQKAMFRFNHNKRQLIQYNNNNNNNNNHNYFNPEFNLELANQLALADWNRDSNRTSGNRLALKKEAFYSSLFELVDLWTQTTNIDEYIEFLSILYHRIAKSSPLSNQFQFKNLDEIKFEDMEHFLNQHRQQAILNELQAKMIKNNQNNNKLKDDNQSEDGNISESIYSDTGEFSEILDTEENSMELSGEINETDENHENQTDNEEYTNNENNENIHKDLEYNLIGPNLSSTVSTHNRTISSFSRSSSHSDGVYWNQPEIEILADYQLDKQRKLARREAKKQLALMLAKQQQQQAKIQEEIKTKKQELHKIKSDKKKKTEKQKVKRKGKKHKTDSNSQEIEENKEPIVQSNINIITNPVRNNNNNETESKPIIFPSSLLHTSPSLGDRFLTVKIPSDSSSHLNTPHRISLSKVSTPLAQLEDKFLWEHLTREIVLREFADGSLAKTDTDTNNNNNNTNSESIFQVKPLAQRTSGLLEPLSIQQRNEFEQIKLKAKRLAEANLRALDEKFTAEIELELKINEEKGEKDLNILVGRKQKQLAEISKIEADLKAQQTPRTRKRSMEMLKEKMDLLQAVDTDIMHFGADANKLAQEKQHIKWPKVKYTEQNNNNGTMDKGARSDVISEKAPDFIQDVLQEFHSIETEDMKPRILEPVQPLSTEDRNNIKQITALVSSLTEQQVDLLTDQLSQIIDTSTMKKHKKSKKQSRKRKSKLQASDSQLQKLSRDQTPLIETTNEAVQHSTTTETTETSQVQVSPSTKAEEVADSMVISLVTTATETRDVAIVNTASNIVKAIELSQTTKEIPPETIEEEEESDIEPEESDIHDDNDYGLLIFDEIDDAEVAASQVSLNPAQKFLAHLLYKTEKYFQGEKDKIDQQLTNLKQAHTEIVQKTNSENNSTTNTNDNTINTTISNEMADNSLALDSKSITLFNTSRFLHPNLSNSIPSLFISSLLNLEFFSDPLLREAMKLEFEQLQIQLVARKLKKEGKNIAWRGAVIDQVAENINDNDIENNNKNNNNNKNTNDNNNNNKDSSYYRGINKNYGVIRKLENHPSITTWSYPAVIQTSNAGRLQYNRTGSNFTTPQIDEINNNNNNLSQYNPHSVRYFQQSVLNKVFQNKTKNRVEFAKKFQNFLASRGLFIITPLDPKPYKSNKPIHNDDEEDENINKFFTIDLATQIPRVYTNHNAFQLRQHTGPKNITTKRTETEISNLLSLFSPKQRKLAFSPGATPFTGTVTGTLDTEPEIKQDEKTQSITGTTDNYIASSVKTPTFSKMINPKTKLELAVNRFKIREAEHSNMANPHRNEEEEIKTAPRNENTSILPKLARLLDNKPLLKPVPPSNPIDLGLTTSTFHCFRGNESMNSVNMNNKNMLDLRKISGSQTERNIRTRHIKSHNMKPIPPPLYSFLYKIQSGNNQRQGSETSRSIYGNSSQFNVDFNKSRGDYSNNFAHYRATPLPVISAAPLQLPSIQLKSNEKQRSATYDSLKRIARITALKHAKFRTDI